MSAKLSPEEKALELEERKVQALETIATSIDSLSLWFEEIDKDEWSDRIQYYLSEFMAVAKNED